MRWNIGLCLSILILTGCWGTSRVKPVPEGVRIANRHYELVFQTTNGLRLAELNNRFTRGNDLAADTSPPLGVLDVGGTTCTLAGMTVTAVESRKGRTTFQLGNAVVACRLSIAHDSTPETLWTLAVENRAGTESEIKISFPVLTSLMPGGRLDPIEYYHGHNGGIFGKDPVHFRGIYGYSSPVMDVYNKKLGGLYLIVKDEKQGLKGLDLIKKEAGRQPPRSNHNRYPQFGARGLFDFDQGCGMAVTFRQTRLSPGEKYETAPVAIGVHPRRWEKAWESYAAWMRTIITPRPIPDWWRRAFISKALFAENFHPADAYDWDRATYPIDGPHSVWTLNGWMDTRGDYNVREDWGGPAPFRHALAALRSRGIRSDLYTEAFQVAKNSQVGRQHGDSWAVLQRGRRLDDGVESPGEWFYCPGSGWQDLYPRIGSRLIEQTLGDVLYLDSVAIRFHLCEDTSHDHPYRDGYHVNVGQFLRKTCEAVDRVRPGTPIFSELWSTDLNAQIVSGCYSNSVHNAVEMTENSENPLACARTGTHLLRFYVPQVKFIEIMDGDEEEVGLSLFNGNAVHQSFREVDLWPFLTECVRVWGQNAGAFASDRPVPLLDTDHDDIHMNKFPARNKTIYTLWNSSYRDRVDQPISFAPQQGRHCVDLFNHIELTPAKGTLNVSLPARRCGIVGELPRVLRLNTTSEGLHRVFHFANLESPSIEIHAKTRSTSSAQPVFVDEFDGQGNLDPARWRVADGRVGRLSGRGTAIFDSEDGVNWTNRKMGNQWDYTKTYTVEIGFRFPGPLQAEKDYIYLSNEVDGSPQSPRFELYRLKFLSFLYQTDKNGSDFYGSSTLPIEPFLKPVDSGEFDLLQVVMNLDCRRVYINGRFYREFPLRAAIDPSSPWLVGLSGDRNRPMEVDFVRVLEGDGAPPSPTFQKRTIAFADPSVHEATINPAELFANQSVDRLAIALLDGEDLVDEVVVK